jgi:hypothetical protein
MDNIHINIEEMPGLIPSNPITVSKLNTSGPKELKNEVLDPSKYNYQAYWEKAHEEERPFEIKTQNQFTSKNVNNKNNLNSQNKPNTPTAKDVSYDDILSSLNVTVQNGKLQLVNKNKSHPQQQSQNLPRQMNGQRYNNQSQIKPNQGLKPTPQQQNYSVPQPKKVTIDPQLKNSKIYNKYFKDYGQEEEPVQIPVFQTREEYMNYQKEQYLKQLEQAKRISEIKSKKLLFDSRHVNVGVSTKNNLRRFSFF